MKLTLKQGEHIDVMLHDSDGCIRVSYGSTKLTVKTDLPDTNGRVGTIYEEIFGGVKGRELMRKAAKGAEEEAQSG